MSNLPASQRFIDQCYSTVYVCHDFLMFSFSFFLDFSQLENAANDFVLHVEGVRLALREGTCTVEFVKLLIM